MSDAGVAPAQRITWVSRTAVGGAALLVLAYPLLTEDASLTRRFLFIGLLALPALALNITLGYSGEFALGQAGSFAVGAYTAAVLTVHFEWRFGVALVVATLAAGLVGVLAGIPGLRIGAWAFALTSLFIAVVIPDIAVTLEEYTGGRNGLPGLPRPEFFGYELSTTGIYVLVVASLAVLLVLVRNASASLWGTGYALMRRSAIAAQSVGAPVRTMKLRVYVISGCIAGFGGAINAHVDGYVSPQAFPLSLSILLIAAVLLGGQGTLVGPVVGIAVLQLLFDAVTLFERYSLLVYGIVLVAGTLFVPRGIVPLVRDLLDRPVRRSAPTIMSRGPRLNSEGAHSLTPHECAALAVHDVGKSFGGVTALDGISLTAEPGKILGVIGPNGSGKTTLLNVICGYYRLDRGEILIGGRRPRRRPEAVAAAGVARTFQTPIVMPDRTAVDNVLAGVFARERRSMMASALWARARAERSAVAHAHALLDAVELAQFAEARVETLSVGQQRMLEIARALATRPGVLLLDEPAAGLAEPEIEVLAVLLRRLRIAGYTIVLIEHNVHLVVDVADQIAVLSVGQVVSKGTPVEIQTDEIVLATYLGEKWTVRS